MHRLLIVDDEYYIREGLKHMLADAGLPVDICAEAGDGATALRRFEELAPDIVLLDINLPDRSGLEVAREIRNKDRDVPLLFLTGYESVAYIREALGLSAVDYLLKPVSREELVAGMRKAEALIRRRKAEAAAPGSTVRERIAAAEHALIDLLLQRSPYADTIAVIRRMKQPLAGMSPPYTVLVCDLDEIPERVSGPEGSQLFGYAFGKMVFEAADSAWTSTGAAVSCTRAAVVLTSPGSYTATDAAVRIRSVLQQYLNVSATVGISRPAARLEDLAEAYRQAQIAAEYKGWVGGGQMIPFDCIQLMEAAGRAMLEKELLLLAEIRAGNEGPVLAILQEWSASLAGMPARQVKLAAIQLVLFVMRIVRSSPLASRADALPQDPLLQLERASASGDIVRFLGSYFVQVGRMIRISREHAVPRMFEEAKEWIRDRLHEEIGLNELAAHLHLSPKYLSARFKQVTGEPFAEYLARLRFDRARELLLDPVRKVADIASAVGFGDANYFSIAFKKQTGHTPTEFRKRYLS